MISTTPTMKVTICFRKFPFTLGSRMLASCPSTFFGGSNSPVRASKVATPYSAETSNTTHASKRIKASTHEDGFPPNSFVKVTVNAIIPVAKVISNFEAAAAYSKDFSFASNIGSASQMDKRDRYLSNRHQRYVAAEPFRHPAEPT